MSCAGYKKKGGNRVAGQVVSINVDTQRTTSRYSPQAGSIACSIGSCHWAYGGCVAHLFRYHRRSSIGSRYSYVLVVPPQLVHVQYRARRWASKRGTRGDAISTEANLYAGYGQRPPVDWRVKSCQLLKSRTLFVYDGPSQRTACPLLRHATHTLPVYETWNLVIGGVREESGSCWCLFLPLNGQQCRYNSRLDLSTGW